MFESWSGRQHKLGGPQPFATEHRGRTRKTVRLLRLFDAAALSDVCGHFWPKKPWIQCNFGLFVRKKPLKSIACGGPTPGDTLRPFACAHCGVIALSFFVSRMTISSTFSGTQASNLIKDFALAGVSWPPCSVCHDDLPYLDCLDCPEDRRNVFGGRRPIDGR